MEKGLKRNHEPSEDVEIPEALKTFISLTMASFGCPTHDEAHCYRVANSAKLIAEYEEGADPRLAFIAATLHDILDSKLQDSTLTAEMKLRQILHEEKGFLTEVEIEKVFTIIKAVGYKNVIKEGYNAFNYPVEYRCVQDADLLDAIGAIGIARCFAFSGKRNRKLFGLSRTPLESSTGITHQQYMTAQGSTTDSAVDHFFDKLLTIEPHLTTVHGKALAHQRQMFMGEFLKQMDIELTDCADKTSVGLSAAVDVMLHTTSSSPSQK